MIQLYSIPQNTPIAHREQLMNQNSWILQTPGILLQTCNRTEFYFGDGDIPPHIYNHLFRVTSGLESNMLGENAIQGQVKQAYLQANEKFKLSKGLHQLFQKALNVGKKVRTESGISRGAVSHSQAATEIIVNSGINLNKAIISLIGAHKLNGDIVKFLKNKGAESFFLANKTYEKAQELASELGCEAMRLNNLENMLQFSDILITATSAPHLIVKFDKFPQNKKMLIIDLAVPRDVDEQIGMLEGVTLYNIDKIEQFIDQKIHLRKKELVMAEEIIKDEVAVLANSSATSVHNIKNVSDLRIDYVPAESFQGNLPETFPFEKQNIKISFINHSLGTAMVNEIASVLPLVNFEPVPFVQNFSQNIKTQLPKILNIGSTELLILPATSVPYPLPENVKIIALVEPEEKTDSLVSKNNLKFSQLPYNAKVGVAAYFNSDELKQFRSDLEIINIEGTFEENLELLEIGVFNAFIVETATLKRLGKEELSADTLSFTSHPLNGYIAVLGLKKTETDYSIFEKIDVRTNYGTVNLVGFGPGDPGLLTLKGDALLKEANIIFYDNLTNKEYLDRYPGAKVYVGKRNKKHSILQDDINRLLYNAAIDGNQVVRLKGGDPMIFAHGGEETEYLKQYHVKVAVVPGITSALAASAITQIPLTHRDFTNAVTLVTGHKTENVNFEGTQTMAIYMGASNARELAIKAIHQGRNPQTPVLLISNISNPNQESEITNLESLTKIDYKLKTPLLMIVGDVVGINSKSNENNNPVIWITGSKEDSFIGPYKNLNFPLVEISPLKSYSALQSIFKKINEFDWIIFTSNYSVTYFFQELYSLGGDVRNLGGKKIASISKSTSQELLKHGIVADVQSKEESPYGLLQTFKKERIVGGHLLIPQSNLETSELAEGFTEAGYKVTTVVVFENNMTRQESLPQLSDYDAVYFTSPTGVENFIRLGQAFQNNKKYITQDSQTFFKLISLGVKPSQIYSREEFQASIYTI